MTHDELNPTEQALRLRRYEALVEVLGVLARASHSVSEVVDAVHEQACRVVNTHVTVLALRTPGGFRCYVRDEDERFTVVIPEREHGLGERVLANGPLNIPEVDEFVAREGIEKRNLHGETHFSRIRSFLGVPILLEGVPTGVLSVQSSRSHAFVDLDAHFLDLLGKHVSIALDHAHLREELQHQAMTDALTGLGNRRAFELALRSALQSAHAAQAKPGAASNWSLALVDLQGFKRVNDRFGHPRGDEVLREVAAALAALHPEGGAFRLGGDEFAVLLRADESEAARRLEEAHHALPHRFAPPLAAEVRLNAGVAAPRDGDDEEAWLRAADDRMYEAKRAGRLLVTPSLT